MKRLLLASALLAACSPASPRMAPVASVSPAVTPPPVSTPQHEPEEEEEEDEGPPLPILQQSPEGNPREGLDKSKGLPGYEQVKALAGNPVPWNPETVMEGQLLYRANCASCHCWDGDGDGPASKGLQPPPRNFGKLKDYKYGTGELALFRTARYGIPNSSMLPAPADLSDTQVWKIVQFVRTLQPAARPREAIIDLQPKPTACVTGGFHDGEVTETDTYAWTDGPVSRLEFPLYPQKGPYHLTVRAKKLPSLPSVHLAVELNGKKLGTVDYTLPTFEPKQLAIPTGALKAGQNRLVLKYSPVANLSGTDGRKSSLAMDYVWVAPGSQ